jgi:hypothetical protein
MKSGYLYVLVHPSDPDLYKIGVTILRPEKRLAQHNSQLDKYAGQVVKETGQKWEIKTYIAVPDPYYAEKAFWGATPLSLVPGGTAIEVGRMKWEWVQAGLDAAMDAGTRSLRPSEPLPDWVLAYTAWINKRLEGRGITLVGHVRSKYGKSNFRCSNGHEWRTVPNRVAEGEGCPQCGIGKREPEERPLLCLLVHPDKPGVIRIGLTCGKPPSDWDGWQIYRYRNVDDDPVLAESLIWELLGYPRPNDGEPINIDLNRAEKAFRELIYRMRQEIAVKRQTDPNGG